MLFFYYRYKFWASLKFWTVRYFWLFVKMHLLRRAHLVMIHLRDFLCIVLFYNPLHPPPSLRTPRLSIFVFDCLWHFGIWVLLVELVWIVIGESPSIVIIQKLQTWSRITGLIILLVQVIHTRCYICIFKI